MLCQNKPEQRQHFHPVILFHNSDKNDSSAILYGDPYYRPLIQMKKRRMDQMLQTNSQWWQMITQTTHDDDDDDDEDHNNDTSPRLSTLSSSSSTCSNNSASSPPPPPSPLQHRQSISKQHSPDRHYYQPQPLRRRRGNLPKTVTAILKQWLIDHCQHPYPTEEEKTDLRNKTGLTLNQISNWFINARRRILPLILVRIQPPSLQEGQDDDDDNDDDDDDDEDDSDYLEEQSSNSSNNNNNSSKQRGRKCQFQRHEGKKRQRHEGKKCM